MRESVWKQDVLQTLFRAPDNCLFQILNALDEQRAALFLLEPDGTAELSVRAEGKSVRCGADGASEEETRLIVQSGREDGFFRMDGAVCAAVRLPQTDPFACLIVPKNRENPLRLDEDSKERLLSQLAEALYENALREDLGGQRQSALCVRELCVQYSSGRQVTHAVNGVSFDVYRGDFTVILGASGCGKTSLLNCIGAMLTPSSGSIIAAGQNVADMNENRRTSYRRNTVGFVFQQYHLIGNLTAGENIAVAAALAADPLPIETVLKSVGLENKEKSYPYQMSGGEQQRLSIARALVKRPSLLLCDEPTGALDTRNALNVVTLLQQLARQQQIPVVMITHNPAFSALADHCLLMSNGTIVEDRLRLFSLSAERLTIL